MADLVFNGAKGRVAELYNRVKTNDPANSALIVVPLAAAGLEADAVLRDYVDLASLLAAANNEPGNVTTYRKTLTDADITALTIDQANDRVDVDVPDLVWTAVPSGAGAWGALLFCYDSDTTTGTDTNVIPLTKHDFAITPDGTNITAQISATGFYRAA